MSFPRAKLQRFNDTPSCAPPPGTYDPKFTSKVKGYVVERQERFAKPKSTTELSESTCSSSGSDKSMSNCMPLLRTPVLQRKFAIKEQPHAKTAESGGNWKETRHCSKCSSVSAAQSTTVLDLEAQICSLKCRINELEQEIINLQECQKNLEADYKQQLAELKQKNIYAVQQLQEHTSRFTQLQEQLSVSEAHLEQSQKICDDLKHSIYSQREQCGQHLQEITELKSCVAILEKDLQSNLIGKCEIKQLKENNLALLNDLQALTVAADEVQKLKEQVSLLESEKYILEKKLGSKQDMILSLQSELSSATVELEDVKLEYEGLVSASELEKSEQEAEVKCTVMLAELEERFYQQQEMYCACSRSVEERILTLQSELQVLTAIHEEELKRLQLGHDEQVDRLEQEKSAIIEHKESVLNTLRESLASTETKLADKSHELCNLKVTFETELGHIKKVHEEDLAKMLSKNVSLVQSKESAIKCLMGNVAMLESQLCEQQHQLHAMTSAHEIKMTEMQKVHREDIKKLLCENASVVSSKENLIKSLQISVVDVELRLASKEQELHDLKRTNDKVVECLHKLDMDGVNKMLQENACAIESKHNVIQALQEALSNMEAELRATVRELGALRRRGEDEMKRVVEAHKEEVFKMSRDNAAVVRTKEALLQTLQANLTTAEAKLLQKQRECDDMKISQIENRLTIVELQDTIDCLTVDFNAKKSELEDSHSKLQCIEKECRKLELSRKNTHESLNALKVRLLETEEYVEHLVRENEEFSVVKQHLVNEVNDLQEKLDTEKLRMDQMEEEMKAEINSIRYSLLAKLEEYRTLAEGREQEIHTANLKKQEIMDGLCVGLEDFKMKLEQVNEKVRALESKNAEQNDELVSKDGKISELAKTLTMQEMLLVSAVEERESLRKVTENQQQKLVEVEELVEKLRTELSELELKGKEEKDAELATHEKTAVPELAMEGVSQDDAVSVDTHLKERLDRCLEELEAARTWEARAKELESLVGPFREQLQAFETERSSLQRSKKATEQELRQLALKYADVLGHQNHQQKIKYMVQLKEHNLQLKQEKELLELRTKQYKRTIDKLKEELAAAQHKKKGPPSSLVAARGKENNPVTAPGTVGSTVSGSPLSELANRHP